MGFARSLPNIEEDRPPRWGCVDRSVGEWVRGRLPGNGVGALRCIERSGYCGKFRKLRPKRPDCYARETAAGRNLREQDTNGMMGAVVPGMDGKRLKYEGLIRNNRLDGIFFCPCAIAHPPVPRV